MRTAIEGVKDMKMCQSRRPRWRSRSVADLANYSAVRVARVSQCLKYTGTEPRKPDVGASRSPAFREKNRIKGEYLFAILERQSKVNCASCDPVSVTH
jgi:hypothetical protein